MPDQRLPSAARVARGPPQSLADPPQSFRPDIQLLHIRFSPASTPTCPHGGGGGSLAPERFSVGLNNFVSVPISEQQRAAQVAVSLLAIGQISQYRRQVGCALGRARFAVETTAFQGASLHRSVTSLRFPEKPQHTPAAFFADVR